MAVTTLILEYLQKLGDRQQAFMIAREALDEVTSATPGHDKLMTVYRTCRPAGFRKPAKLADASKPARGKKRPR